MWQETKQSFSGNQFRFLSNGKGIYNKICTMNTSLSNWNNEAKRNVYCVQWDELPDRPASATVCDAAARTDAVQIHSMDVLVYILNQKRNGIIEYNLWGSVRKRNGFACSYNNIWINLFNKNPESEESNQISIFPISLTQMNNFLTHFPRSVRQIDWRQNARIWICWQTVDVFCTVIRSPRCHIQLGMDLPFGPRTPI